VRFRRELQNLIRETAENEINEARKPKMDYYDSKSSHENLHLLAVCFSSSIPAMTRTGTGTGTGIDPLDIVDLL
jgi:hypothetical protein